MTENMKRVLAKTYAAFAVAMTAEHNMAGAFHPDNDYADPGFRMGEEDVALAHNMEGQFAEWFKAAGGPDDQYSVAMRALSIGTGKQYAIGETGDGKPWFGSRYRVWLDGNMLMAFCPDTGERSHVSAVNGVAAALGYTVDADGFVGGAQFRRDPGFIERRLRIAHFRRTVDKALDEDRDACDWEVAAAPAFESGWFGGSPPSYVRVEVRQDGMWRPAGTPLSEPTLALAGAQEVQP